LQFSAAVSLLSATFDNCNNAMPQDAIDARGSSSSSSSSSSPAKDQEDVPIDIVIMPNASCLSQIEKDPFFEAESKGYGESSGGHRKKDRA
jgi:hypothetical protein